MSHTTCSLCQLPGARLNAGGTVGMVHRACFALFDAQDEAHALEGCAGLLGDMPLPTDVPPPPRRDYRRQPPPTFTRVEVCL